MLEGLESSNYIPYLCFDDYNSKSLVSGCKFARPNFQGQFKTQVNTRRNFAKIKASTRRISMSLSSVSNE